MPLAASLVGNSTCLWYDSIYNTYWHYNDSHYSSYDDGTTTTTTTTTVAARRLAQLLDDGSNTTTTTTNTTATDDGHYYYSDDYHQDLAGRLSHHLMCAGLPHCTLDAVMASPLGACSCFASEACDTCQLAADTAAAANDTSYAPSAGCLRCEHCMSGTGMGAAFEAAHATGHTRWEEVLMQLCFLNREVLHAGAAGVCLDRTAARCRLVDNAGRCGDPSLPECAPMGLAIELGTWPSLQVASFFNCTAAVDRAACDACMLTLKSNTNMDGAAQASFAAACLTATAKDGAPPPPVCDASDPCCGQTPEQCSLAAPTCTLAGTCGLAFDPCRTSRNATACAALAAGSACSWFAAPDGGTVSDAAGECRMSHSPCNWAHDQQSCTANDLCAWTPTCERMCAKCFTCAYASAGLLRGLQSGAIDVAALKNLSYAYQDTYETAPANVTLPLEVERLCAALWGPNPPHGAAGCVTSAGWLASDLLTTVVEEGRGAALFCKRHGACGGYDAATGQWGTQCDGAVTFDTATNADVRLDFCSASGVVLASEPLPPSGSSALDCSACSAAGQACTTSYDACTTRCDPRTGWDVWTCSATCVDQCEAMADTIAARNAGICATDADCAADPLRPVCKPLDYCVRWACSPDAGLTYSNCTGRCVPTQPRFVSAQFSDDLTQLVVTLSERFPDAWHPCSALIDSDLVTAWSLQRTPCHVVDPAVAFDSSAAAAVNGTSNSTSSSSSSFDSSTLVVHLGSTWQSAYPSVPTVGAAVRPSATSPLLGLYSGAYLDPSVAVTIQAPDSPVTTLVPRVAGPARVSTACYSATLLPLVFDASASEPKSGIVSFAWTAASGPTPNAAATLQALVDAATAGAGSLPRVLYLKQTSTTLLPAGDYVLRLTVTDILGLTATHDWPFTVDLTSRLPMLAADTAYAQTFSVARGIAFAPRLALPTAASGCNFTSSSNVTYAWSIAASDAPVEVANATLRLLNVTADQLEAAGYQLRQTIELWLEVCSAPEPSACSRFLLSQTGRLRLLGLAPSVKGPSGDVLVDASTGSNAALFFNASSSVDLDDVGGDYGSLLFSWACSRSDSRPCFANAPLSIEPTFSLNATEALAAGADYATTGVELKLTLTLSKTYSYGGSLAALQAEPRSASIPLRLRNVTATSGTSTPSPPTGGGAAPSPPQAALPRLLPPRILEVCASLSDVAAGTALCPPVLNPSKQLRLLVAPLSVNASAPLASYPANVTITWTTQPALGANDVVASASRRLVIITPSALQALTVPLTVSVSVVDPATAFQVGSATSTFTVNTPPFCALGDGSSPAACLSVSPSTGGSTRDVYQVTAAGWQDAHSASLRYEFGLAEFDTALQSYRYDVRLPASPLPAAALRGLPDGNVTVYACAYDEQGARACGLRSVVVTEPVDVDDVELSGDLDELEGELSSLVGNIELEEAEGDDDTDGGLDSGKAPAAASALIDMAARLALVSQTLSSGGNSTTLLAVRLPQVAAAVMTALNTSRTTLTPAQFFTTASSVFSLAPVETQQSVLEAVSNMTGRLRGSVDLTPADVAAAMRLLQRVASSPSSSSSSSSPSSPDSRRHRRRSLMQSQAYAADALSTALRGAADVCQGLLSSQGADEPPQVTIVDPCASSASTSSAWLMLAATGRVLHGSPAVVFSAVYDPSSAAGGHSFSLGAPGSELTLSVASACSMAAPSRRLQALPTSARKLLLAGGASAGTGGRRLAQTGGDVSSFNVTLPQSVYDMCELDTSGCAVYGLGIATTYLADTSALLESLGGAEALAAALPGGVAAAGSAATIVSGHLSLGLDNLPEAKAGLGGGNLTVSLSLNTTVLDLSGGKALAFVRLNDLTAFPITDTALSNSSVTALAAYDVQNATATGTSDHLGDYVVVQYTPPESPPAPPPPATSGADARTIAATGRTLAAAAFASVWLFGFML